MPPASSKLRAGIISAYDGDKYTYVVDESRMRVSLAQPVEEVCKRQSGGLVCVSLVRCWSG